MSEGKLRCLDAPGSDIELCPNYRVIGGRFGSPGRHVDLTMDTTLRQWLRGENMVDPPAEIPLQCISIVIPIGVLNGIGVEFSEHVDKPPVARLFVGVAGVNMEIDIIDALLRVINVNGLGSDVQVSKPNSGFHRVKGRFEVLA